MTAGQRQVSAVLPEPFIVAERFARVVAQRIGEIDRLRCRQRVDEEFSSAAMAQRVTEWLAEVLSVSRGAMA